MSDDVTNSERSAPASNAGGRGTSSRPSHGRAIVVLSTSFVVISLLGVWLFCWDPADISVQAPIGPIGSCTVFVAFMAGVHFIGYRLWRRQFTQGPGDKIGSALVSPAYERPAKAALL